MNCQTATERLLTDDDPSQPSADVAAHLRHCGDCRRHQSYITRLERSLSRIPIPASMTGKAMLIDRLLPKAAGHTPAVSSPARPEPQPALAGWWRWPAGAMAVAATLLLSTWLFLRPRAAAPDAPRDPFLAAIVQRNLTLATAQTPDQRVSALADLADDLHHQGRTLARVAVGEDMSAIARLYERVLLDGLVRRTQEVAPTERPAVVARLTERLAKAGQSADGLAGEVPPASAAPLRAMASAARDASAALRALTREGPA